MKKIALAAFSSLLMASTASANKWFTTDAEQGDAAVRALGQWLSFTKEFDDLRGRTVTYTADHPISSLAAEKKAYAKALEADGVTDEGTSHLAFLNNPRTLWDVQIKAALGGDDDPKFIAFAAALAACKGEAPEGMDSWERWHRGVMGKANHTPAISVDLDQGQVTWSPVESLILAALTDDDRYDSPRIYGALTESGYLSLTPEGQEIFDDENKTFPLASRLEGIAEVRVGAARVLQGRDQRKVFGESNAMTGVKYHKAYVGPESDAVVVNTTHLANADLVVDSLDSPDWWAAFQDASLDSAQYDTGFYTPMDNPELLQVIAAKLKPGAMLRFSGLGPITEGDRHDRLVEAGFSFHSYNDGILAFNKAEQVEGDAAGQSTLSTDLPEDVHLPHYWAQNPGAREWGIANGRFVEGDVVKERWFARMHYKHNANAKWTPPI